MEIFISDIPDEGLHLEGELPGTIFDLPPGDSVRPLGRAQYSADIYAFEDVIVINGWLRAPFQLQCGTCLEFFDYNADFPDWSTEIDLEPEQRSFELNDVIREDFLLGLPQYPRCDDYDEDHICPKSHFVSDTDQVEELQPSDEEKRNIWGALDQWG